MKAVIPYMKRNEPELLGFDEQSQSTCVREHSYCYDSFNEKYKRLKFTRRKECAACSSREDSLRQKVYKKSTKILVLSGFCYSLKAMYGVGGGQTHQLK